MKQHTADASLGSKVEDLVQNLLHQDRDQIQRRYTPHLVASYPSFSTSRVYGHTQSARRRKLPGTGTTARRRKLLGTEA
eukprot:3154605-Rhodomonas_salina.3